MKERKETINLKTANLFSLALFAATAVVFIVVYLLVWQPGKEAVKAAVSDPALVSLPLIGALLGGIVVHELIHGVCWAMFAPSGFKSISFGVIWKMLTPYCHCNEPLKVKHYSIGALAPLVLLGIFPAIAGVVFHSYVALAYGVVFISAAAGDIMVAWRLRKEPAGNTVLDHPTEAGYIVYEEDK